MLARPEIIWLDGMEKLSLMGAEAYVDATKKIICAGDYRRNQWSSEGVPLSSGSGFDKVYLGV